MEESLLDILARLSVPVEAFADLAGIERDDVYAISEGAALPSPRTTAVLRLVRSCGVAKLAPIIAALSSEQPRREWRTIRAFPDYEVSNDGLVRRRTTSGKGSLRVLKQRTANNGYLTVTLYRSGRPEPQRVHRLVCAAFHGEPTPGRPNALHRNGTAKDNREDNLYWGTQQENAADWQRHRRSRIAESVRPPYSLMTNVELRQAIRSKKISRRKGIEELQRRRIAK